MKRRFPFHPLLFAAYPVLQLYSFNVSEVPLSDVPLALACSLALACLVAALAWLPLRNLRKAAILASLFLWLFFSWANMHLALRGVRIGHFPLAQFWLIGVFFLAALALGAVVIWRTRNDLGNLTRILNAAGIFLVLSCVMLFSFKLAQYAKLPVPPDRHPRPARRQALAPGPHPDIYFILLDQYPRSDVLREGFGCDNSDFLSGLRKLGFYVARYSASNYPRTAMSLASTLNLAYLDALMGPVKEDCRDLGLPAKWISHNEVFSFLRAHGYRTIYLPCEYGAGHVDDADIVMESGALLSEFNQILMQMTPVDAAVKLFAGFRSTAELHRRHVLFTLESLRSLPRKGFSPLFVYAHILCPHPPIVWGARGERVFLDLPSSTPETWTMNSAARHSYVNQVLYISKLAEETVKTILARSHEPPIIILCSDHGSEFEVDWRSAEKSNMQERMANLAAFYAPGGAGKLFYPNVTNVNFFRILFDHFFGTHYGLLPDRSYFSTNDRPYRFIQVPMDVRYIDRPNSPG